ncbi:hypothetical protein ACF0H5_010184 [Mactra antiquata]
MNCRNVPGLTLSIVKGTQTWTRGFGVADLDKDIPVTDETLFLIGSLGKSFTMTLLGIMLEKTSYNWTTKISDIEELNLEFIDDVITREVTIGDMLSHSTGLSAVTDYGFIGGYPDGTTRELLSQRTKYIPKVSEFRESFVYNNMLYALLGYLTELVGDDTWQNLMTSHLLEPLGMTSSKPLGKSVMFESGYAKPYIMPDTELEDGHYNIYSIYPLEPAGGIISNGKDMTKWMMFNLKSGKTEDGNQLLNKTVFNEAFKEQNYLPYGGASQSIKSPNFPVNDSTNAYGYAWFTSKYKGHRKIWHSGGLFSYISLLWMFPEEDIGIFVSVNGPALPKTSSYAEQTILYYISDILLGDKPWLDLETTCTFPKPWTKIGVEDLDIPQPSNNFTTTNLTRFIGNYGNILLPDIKVSIREGDVDPPYLWLELNRIKGELLPTEDEYAFKFKMVDPWEYAIERYLTKTVIIKLPLHFITMDEVVSALEFTFGPKEVIRFEKNAHFMPVSSSVSHAVQLSMMFLTSVIASSMSTVV